MSVKKNFTGRDAFYRMKYLHQIADMCRQKEGDDYGKLMLYYGHQIVSIGKKTQTRMAPKMKRTLCKGCHCILQPGDTETVAYVKCKKQPDKMVNTCVICGTVKSYDLKPGYRLWCEKPEAIINVIDSNPQINVTGGSSSQESSSKKASCNNGYRGEVASDDSIRPFVLDSTDLERKC